jgi:UDP-N-acetylglucosamine acyltransferase
VIHPSAIIHPGAKLHPDIQVGPFVVIDADVTVGAGCVLEPHVYLTGSTIIGTDNRFYAGCVIGGAPQDLKYKDEPTKLRIGDGNVFREHVTVHRSAHEGKETVIGSHNFLMANSHVGHNSRLGDHNILANGVLLGGHVAISDRVFLGGNAVVHQNTRLGALCMMQGLSAISKDLPPFTIARGRNTVCGLNTVGLRRAGIASVERLELRKLYQAIYRSGLGLRQAAKAARERFTGPSAQLFLTFVEESSRGICSERGRRSPESAAEGE